MNAKILELNTIVGQLIYLIRKLQFFFKTDTVFASFLILEPLNSR